MEAFRFRRGIYSTYHISQKSTNPLSALFEIHPHSPTLSGNGLGPDGRSPLGMTPISLRSWEVGIRRWPVGGKPGLCTGNGEMIRLVFDLDLGLTDLTLTLSCA